METMEKEKIRETVRDRYGSIARAGNDTPESGPAASCCSTSEIKNNAFPLVSCCGTTDAASGQEASCCGAVDFSVEKMAAYMGNLGYSLKDLDSAPDGANMMLGFGYRLWVV